MEDRCVCCGEVIPEGTQVCPKCLGASKRQAKKSKQLIYRDDLIAEYDRVHIGEPGKARKLMEDAPTVDAVEVVHGRWEQVQRWATKAKYRCSVCGREIMSAVKVNIEKYPYCHCGAKMDGDGNG